MSKINYGAAFSYIEQYVESGHKILPADWSKHLTRARYANKCVFCTSKIVGDITFFTHYHDSAIDPDFSIIRNGDVALPICRACEGVLEEENTKKMSPNQLSVSERKIKNYYEALPEAARKNIQVYVEQGIIPNLDLFLFNKNKEHCCFICNGNGTHNRPDLANLDLTKSKIANHYLEYTHVPVGQVNLITDELAICKNCLDACEHHLNTIGIDYNTAIVYETCISCKESYAITQEEYTKRKKNGTIDKHQCMGCLSTYLGSTRVFEGGITCATCLEHNKHTQRSFDISYAGDKEISALYLSQNYKDESNVFTIPYLCEKSNFNCRLNDKKQEIFRLEEINSMNKSKGKRKQLKSNAQETTTASGATILERIPFKAEGLPIIVRLERITCNSSPSKEAFIVSLFSTGSDTYEKNQKITSFSSAPEYCGTDGNSNCELCGCHSSFFEANLHCAKLLEANKNNF